MAQELPFVSPFFHFLLTAIEQWNYPFTPSREPRPEDDDTGASMWERRRGLTMCKRWGV